MGVFEFRVAKEFDVVKVRVSREGQERIARLQCEKKCLGCEEKFVEDERSRRGLCATCYGGVMNAVRKHGVSESELMREGKLLPPSKGGRKPRNAFTASLLGRESEVS